MPDGAVLTNGTYCPSNFTPADVFPSPAPPAPYQSTMADFIGDSPNGTWSLYVVDDSASDFGSIAGGWTLDVTVGPPLDITRISGQRAVLSWPDYAVGFNVETKGALTNATWFPLAATPIANGGQYRVTNSIGPTNLFYRLVK